MMFSTLWISYCIGVLFGAVCGINRVVEHVVFLLVVLGIVTQYFFFPQSLSVGSDYAWYIDVLAFLLVGFGYWVGKQGTERIMKGRR